MQHIGNKIDRIIKEKNLKSKEIADKADITSVYLSQIKKKSSIDTELLEKIAAALNVPISSFFDESITVEQNVSARDVTGNIVGIDNRHYYSDSPDVLKAQIDILEERIKEKDSLIKEKDSQIKEKDSLIKELLNILKNK